MKKTYTITFKAELTEDDLNAMQSCFYQAMNEAMEIEDVWGLEIEEDEIPDIEEAKKYTMHIDDVEDGLYACETIGEVRDFLDNIPNKFGEWDVDVVGEGEDAYYEVTNTYYDYMAGETRTATYDLEIEVEDDE
jgi:hypothetical protein